MREFFGWVGAVLFITPIAAVIATGVYLLGKLLVFTFYDNLIVFFVILGIISLFSGAVLIGTCWSPHKDN